MIEIVAVPPWRAVEVGEKLRAWIELACRRSVDVSPDSLIAEASRREAVLWLVSGDEGHGICFTRCVLLADERKAVEVTALGGHGALIWTPQLRDRLHEFRKAEGAVLLFVVGRKGWGRMFSKEPVGMIGWRYIFEDYG